MIERDGQGLRTVWAFTLKSEALYRRATNIPPPNLGPKKTETRSTRCRRFAYVLNEDSRGPEGREAGGAETLALRRSAFRHMDRDTLIFRRPVSAKLPNEEGRFPKKAEKLNRESVETATRELWRRHLCADSGAAASHNRFRPTKRNFPRPEKEFHEIYERTTWFRHLGAANCNSKSSRKRNAGPRRKRSIAIRWK